MHPEILRELSAQRSRELQRAMAARAVSRTLRARRRNRRVAADELIVPAVPDYVDGSFQSAGDEAVSEVAAARRAA